MHRLPGVWFEFFVCTPIDPLKAARGLGCPYKKRQTKHVFHLQASQSYLTSYTRHDRVLI